MRKQTTKKKRKARKKRKPANYVTGDFYLEDKLRRRKRITKVATGIKVAACDEPLIATSTVRSGYRFFHTEDRTIEARIKEEDWQELLRKARESVTVKDIWGK